MTQQKHNNQDSDTTKDITIGGGVEEDVRKYSEMLGASLENCTLC